MDRCAVLEWAADVTAPSAVASRVLITLARMSEDGVCSASQVDIARRSFLSERQTRTILKQLEAHEYALISRERRGGSGHGRHYDVYRLALPEQPEKAQPANIAAALVEEQATGNFLQNAVKEPEQPAISVKFVEATGNPCVQPANIAAASEATGNPPHTPLLDNLLVQSSSCSVATPLAPQAEPIAIDQPAPAKPKRAKAEKRGHRIPADWRPSVTDRDYALTSGVPSARIDRLAEEFRDYWLGAAQATAWKLDWSGTWRNQVRRFIDRNPHLAPETKNQNLFDADGVAILEHPNVTRIDRASGARSGGFDSTPGGGGSRPLSRAARWARAAHQA